MEEVKTVTFSVEIDSVLDVLADLMLIKEKVIDVEYEEEIAHIKILK